MPTCSYPEALEGVPVSELDFMSVDWCLNNYSVSDASSTADIIRHGEPIFWTIVVGGGAMLLGLIFLIIVVVYTRHRARYYTHEDHMSE